MLQCEAEADLLGRVRKEEKEKDSILNNTRGLTLVQGSGLATRKKLKARFDGLAEVDKEWGNRYLGSGFRAPEESSQFKGQFSSHEMIVLA